MARALSVAMLAAIAAGTVRPVIFYEGEYSSGFLRLWSGVGTYSWGGQSWLGAGEMIGVAPIGEASGVRAIGFSVSLSGESSTLLTANLAAAGQGLPGKVWLGAFDSAGALVADPFLCFSGRLDVPEIVDSGAICTIAVAYESRLIDLDKARNRRWTHEDQQQDYPADLGFEYVPALQNAEIPWGNVSKAEASAFASKLRSSRLG